MPQRPNASDASDSGAPPRAQSEVIELKASDAQGGLRTLPFLGWATTARLFAELAQEHVTLGEMGDARAAAEDALLILDTITDPQSLAEVSLVLGETLLALHEAHRAKERFVASMPAFDLHGDATRAARARLGVARAMRMLGDPAARPMFEDAGTLFEELGDEATVLAIESELRALEADFEETPRSFQSVSKIASLPKR